MALTNWRVPFYLHDLGQPELDAVAAVLATPVLTTGEWVDRFEEQLAAHVGRRAAVGVTSATGALHLSLLAAGVGPGDEVVTTPLTFAASATAVLQAGATPVFADVEPDTGNLDLDRVPACLTPRTKAVLPVHLYGQMCDMHGLAELAGKHGLAVVEDAAHCVEGSRDGLRPGDAAVTACFSFYATKSLTSGEGGAIVTDDEALAARLRLLRLHGMDKPAAQRVKRGYTHWDIVDFGWKYNMDNIQAALLLPQLPRMDDNWRRRRHLAQRYAQRLASVEGVSWPGQRPGVQHAHHLFTVWVDPERRDQVIDGLQQAGVGCAVNYRPVHLLQYFQQRYGYQRGAFPNAERIGDSTISLPLYPRMRDEDVDLVVDALQAVLAGRRVAAGSGR